MGRPKKIINPEIGKRIKIIRKRMKITQAQFAEEFNVTEQAVRNWENGRNEVPMNVIETLSSNLGIDIPFILAKSNIPNLTQKCHEWDVAFGSEKLSYELSELKAIEHYLNRIGYKTTYPYWIGKSDNETFPYLEVSQDPGQTFTVSETEYKQLIERVKNLVIFELEAIKNSGYFARGKNPK